MSALYERKEHAELLAVHALKEPTEDVVVVQKVATAVLPEAVKGLLQL